MQIKDANRNRKSIALLAVLCAVLQLALAPNIGIANGRANFAIVFVGIVSLLIGGQTSVTCGFLAGLFFDLSSTGPIGLMSLLLTLGSFVLGMEERNRLSEEPAASFIMFAICCLVICIIYNMAMMLVGLSSSIVDVLFLRSVPMFILTMIAFVPFALYYGGISGWGGMGGMQRKGHYTLGNM